MTRKLYSEERLVVRRLVKDEHKLTWLMENDLLDDGWMPVAGVPVWKLGGIADRLGDYFGLDDKWKFFSDLWDKDRNYMRTKWNEAKNMAKEKEFSKNILCRIR